jgi:hypothetical protein
MKDLMVHVERAVRPVRANERRKLAMRRELLAHLTAIYDEEKARHSDDPAALRAALERFGEPAVLTRDLQAAVPLAERLLNVPIPGLWRPEERYEEPTALRAAHGILLATVAGYLAAVPFLGPLPASHPPALMPARAAGAAWVAAIVVLAAVFIFLANIVYETARRPAGRSAWLKAGAATALALAVHAASTAVTAVLVGVDLDAVAAGLPYSLLFTAFMFLALAAAAPVLEWSARPYREWLTLDLPPAASS